VVAAAAAAAAPAAGRDRDDHGRAARLPRGDRGRCGGGPTDGRGGGDVRQRNRRL